MLTLDATQWADLKARDMDSFVAAVCDQYLETRPEMAAAPGRNVILRQMQGAHDYAVRAGFTSNPHIVRWLYFAADAPGIHEDKQIDSYLRKPGATPEQRLDDMLALVMHELRELGGSD